MAVPELPLDSCLLKELGVGTACEIGAQFFEVSDRLAQIIAAQPSCRGCQYPRRHSHEIQETSDLLGVTSNHFLVGNRETGMLGKEFCKLSLSTPNRFKVFLAFVRIERYGRHLRDGLAVEGQRDVSDVVGDMVGKITTKQVFAAQVDDTKIPVVNNLVSQRLI